MTMPQTASPGNDLPLKLSKLIRRLSSEHDGEVVATVRAVERVLKSDGHDLHALADIVEQFGGIILRRAPVYAPSTPAWKPSWQPSAPDPKPKPPPAPKWGKLGKFRRSLWLDQLCLDSKLCLGGLPHAGYVGKFRAYRERLKSEDATLTRDEIALIDRWIGAFWNNGTRT